jgi:hypothetical protein
MKYFSAIVILSCLCVENELYFWVITRNETFGSFVCICDSLNEGKKVLKKPNKLKTLDNFCEKSKCMTDSLLDIFENAVDCTVC